MAHSKGDPRSCALAAVPRPACESIMPLRPTRAQSSVGETPTQLLSQRVQVPSEDVLRPLLTQKPSSEATWTLWVSSLIPHERSPTQKRALCAHQGHWANPGRAYFEHSEGFRRNCKASSPRTGSLGLPSKPQSASSARSLSCTKPKPSPPTSFLPTAPAELLIPEPHQSDWE